MNRAAAWILAGLMWPWGAAAEDWNALPSATNATERALEQLILDTRPGEGERAPFILQDGPADPRPPAVVDDELEQAIVLMQEKDYAAAVPLLERSLKFKPTVEPIWEALGWSYYHTGRSEEAERLWQQYLNLRPESPKAYSLLAQLALLRNDWRAGDRYLEGSLKQDPKSFDIRYWYAQNLFRLGRLEPAVKIFETLVEEDPYRYDVKLDLARIYTLVQRYEDSLDLWTEIVEEIPGNLDFRTDFARALMLVGSLDEADEQARRVLAEDPSRWTAMNIRADVAEIAQDSEAMLESLKQLIEDADDDLVRARLRIRLGSRLVVLGRKDPSRWPLTMALEQYEAALEVVKTSVPWWTQYAQIAIMAHQFEKAEEVCEKILTEFNPHNHPALKMRYEIAMMRKDFNAAEKALNEVYESYQPDNPYRELDLARLEIQRGRYQNAMDALDRLEEAGNHSVFTLLYHGLTESEWMALTSTRRLYEHLVALQNAGFRFIAPSDIPSFLESGKRRLPQVGPKPWLARLVESVHYAFTGVRSTPLAEDVRPAKVAAVTFDDGLRTSYQLGTPIAEELGITFGMAVITSLEELNAPIYAAWEEIKAAQDTGVWENYSHLMYANTDQPTGPEPEPKVYNLVNRIWKPERNRLETLREWSARIRRDFEQSRALLEKHLELPPGSPLPVAYPYSEIGQLEGSNVAKLINPIRAVLNEAARMYQMGMVVDGMGYTCPGDNILMVRRYEPGWDEDAEEVVENALSTHPVFAARRLRAEIATLLDMPYLAEKQIELLRRDGYPDRLLRELINFTQNRIPTAAPSTGLDKADRSGTSRRRLRPSNLYLSAAYTENQSNEQILQQMFDIRGGMNLNQYLGVEAAYRSGTIDQTVTTNTWFEVARSETASSTEVRTETTDGETTTSTIVSETTTTRNVQTNRIDKYEYSADIQEIRASLTLRINDHATLLANAGQKTLKLKPGHDQAGSSESEIVGTLTMAWRPFHALQVITSVDHDLIPSARRKIAYESFYVNAIWKVNDSWELTGDARYWSLEDNNALAMMALSSMWKVFERQGIWAGLESSVYSMDEDNVYYWSPYWDTRYNGVVRIRRSYQDYFFQFDARLGRQKEKARPEIINEWLNLQAQAEKDGNWSAGSYPEMDWDTFFGFGGSYRQRIWRHLDLIGNISVNFLRNYSEHNYTAGLQYNF